jgi:RNA polymerase sigma factor (sigma-70 family)
VRTRCALRSTPAPRCSSRRAISAVAKVSKPSLPAAARAIGQRLAQRRSGELGLTLSGRAGGPWTSPLEAIGLELAGTHAHAIPSARSPQDTGVAEPCAAGDVNLHRHNRSVRSLPTPERKAKRSALTGSIGVQQQDRQGRTRLETAQRNQAELIMDLKRTKGLKFHRPDETLLRLRPASALSLPESWLQVPARMLAAEMHSVQQTGATMSLSSPRRHERDLKWLVHAIRDNNDDRAWAELIVRFDRTLRTIARSYRLSPTDIDDVVQTVWLRLYQRQDRLRDPDAIAGWLATTTRRASLNVLQRHVREELTDDLEPLQDTELNQPNTELLEAERKAVLQRALATLPAHQRRLMVLLATEPTDYRKISAGLDMPMGSIGPTRARSLDRLRQHPELRDLYLNAR